MNNTNHSPTNDKSISMNEALDQANKFLDLGTGIESKDGKTGVQFIQQGTNSAGQDVTKRVGFDVNPNSSHVQKVGPHLNLQTQINGKIQKTGSAKDPHTPISPGTIRKGDF